MPYEIEVEREGSDERRVIRGSDPYVVQQEAQAQIRTWQAEYALGEVNDILVKAVRDDRMPYCPFGKTHIVDLLDDLKGANAYHRALFEERLNVWGFDEPMPQEPEPLDVPSEPVPRDGKYFEMLRERQCQPKTPEEREAVAEYRRRRGWRGGLYRGNSNPPESYVVQEAMYDYFYRQDHPEWLETKQRLILQDQANMECYMKKLKEWGAQADQFLAQRRSEAEAAYRAAVLNRDKAGVTDYFGMVLTNSQYPGPFPRDYDIDYNPETKTLVAEFRLPSPQDLPTLKEVRYVQSSDEFKEIHLSESAFNKMYNDLLYKIALRSIHELYQADVVGALDSIVFNGWVNSIDKATGKEIRPCVLSVQAGREEFLAIDLAQVDPKACFRKLKGVAASKLHALSAVPPVMMIDREDTRFVGARDVAGSLAESENLAAMDWQDFEQLVRELFEKEFAQGGGEVNVTRASRDYGVDAIAFDPDPIRGGKIVIQAKRYTNVVGVAAVRDLYGTVIN